MPFERARSFTPTFVASAFALAVALPFLIPAAAAPGQPGAGQPRVSPGLVPRAESQGAVRVIVRVAAPFFPEAELPGPAAAAAQRSEIRRLQDFVLDSLAGRYVARVKRFATIPYFAAEVDAAALRALEASPWVEAVVEDVPVPPALMDSGPLVGAPDAWSAGYTGSGWTVAVLDTGVDKTHPFLSGKVVSEACYSTTYAPHAATSLCPGGVEESTSPGSAVPCTGIGGCDHGTHVAGIAVGKGTSFSGLARDASLIAIQVFSRFDSASLCGSSPVPCILSYTSDQILGLERVYALRGTFNVAAANLSIGGGRFTAPCDDDPTKAIIDQLRAAGIATVISSGNSGYSDALAAPACISTAVSVGSTTKADVVSSFSNTASFLSLLAPGSSITSSIPGGTFGVKSGTSMAAPHVTGAWALLKQRKPSVSVSEGLSVLQATGQSVFDPRNGFAFPRIRVKAALDALVVARMAIDTPTGGAAATQPFAIAGWAIDQGATSGTGVDAVHIWAYPNPGSGTPPVFLGAASYGGVRPDVGAAFGAQFTNSGYGLMVRGLAPGPYQLVAYAHSTVTGTFNNAQAVTVTVAANPRMSVDEPPNGATRAQPFAVAGWALDLAAASGPGVDAVHVWAYPNPGSGTPPIFLGAASYGGARPDVGAAFGAQFTNSGYGLIVRGLAPGPYQLVVYAHSAVTGTFNQAVAVTVQVTANPRMHVDVPAPGATVSRPFLVAGWALDLAAASGTGVDTLHVWAHPVGGGAPVFLGAVSYGGSRPDVGSLFGSQFTNSGFGLIGGAGLAPGAYDLVVYLHSTVAGAFVDARVVRVTVS
jgi:subtilisin